MKSLSDYGAAAEYLQGVISQIADGLRQLRAAADAYGQATSAVALSTGGSWGSDDPADVIVAAPLANFISALDLPEA
jgi:hypothetical protein